MQIQAWFAYPSIPTPGAVPLTLVESAASFDAVDPVDELRDLLRHHTGRKQEARILEILRGLDTDELNDALVQLDVAALFSTMDDHSTGPKNLTAVVKLLSNERLDELTPDSRVAIVTGMQTGRTRTVEERGIRDVFLGTHGADLTALKNGIDGGGDHHDLQELVFSDIDDESVKNEILAHIQREAVTNGDRKVLSDIDDTFYANWVDLRFPKKTVYPGVRQFYSELDAARQGDRIAFVTARPNEPSGTVKDMTIDMLRSKGAGEAVVLAGRITHFVGNDRIAEMKYKTFQDYRALYPEYPFVFVGDSGQGDPKFGLAMLETPNSAVQGVFIHDVVNTSAADRQIWRERGVIFFDTYTGAALEAFRKNLIGPEALSRIGAATVREMRTVPYESAAQRQAREADLAREVMAANAVLSAELQIRL